MTGRALISGAGVAGLAAGWWLARYGWQGTVVERSPTLRTGGQNVDVRGAAREVLRRMDLDDAVADRGTGEVGTRFVDDDGRSVGEFPAGTSDSDGATAEREILRGQFVQLLEERTRGDLDVRFGTWIEHIDRSGPGDEVRVQFADGRNETFDVVIIAEGIGSMTRGLLDPAFGDVRRRDLGVSIAYFSVDRVTSDDDWWRWYNAPGGRTATLRPDNVGRQRATLSFRTDSAATGPAAEADPLRRFVSRFDDAGWQTRRLIDGLRTADDAYFDDIGQIVAQRWSSGRIVLVGDAAYCPSPVSGMGTSLALVGAYVLAGELAGDRRVADALRSYEQVMRPYVRHAQRLPPGVPGIMHPRSRVGVAALRTVFRLAAAGPMRAFEEKLFSPPADRIDLPDYPAPLGRH